MAQILLKQPGQPVADLTIAGSIITVAGVKIDCAERQQDSAVNVEVRHSGNGALEGGSGAYMAHIAIPARRYAPAETEDGAAVAIPLDPNAIEITLWPTV